MATIEFPGDLRFYKPRWAAKSRANTETLAQAAAAPTCRAPPRFGSPTIQNSGKSGGQAGRVSATIRETRTAVHGPEITHRLRGAKRGRAAAVKRSGHFRTPNTIPRLRLGRLQTNEGIRHCSGPTLKLTGDRRARARKPASAGVGERWVEAAIHRTDKTAAEKMAAGNATNPVRNKNIKTLNSARTVRTMAQSPCTVVREMSVVMGHRT